MDPKLILALRLILMLVTASFVSSNYFRYRGNRHNCPSNCRCWYPRNKAFYQNVSCSLYRDSSYAAISQLTNWTKSLTCSLSTSEGFRDDLADFSELTALETLSVVMSSRLSNAVNFTRGDLFESLTNLRSLTINLPLDYFNVSVFKPLRKLKILEFSNARLPDVRNLLSILKGVAANLAQLEQLSLINVQWKASVDATMRLKDHIFENLKDLPIKVLNLSDNKVVLLQHGLTKYLPQLQVFRVGSRNLMTFEIINNFLSCSLAEILLHDNLREYTLSFPEMLNFFGEDSPSYFEPFSVGERARLQRCYLNSSSTSNLCDLVNCVCQQTIQVPCNTYGKSDTCGGPNRDRPD